jgi:putative oxidoreductase
MNKFLDSIGPYADLVGHTGTQAYMQAAGVAGALLPLVILVELGGGIAIVAGLYTRLAALLLAGFTILTALLFHTGADQIQHIMFMKNLGLAGGFLFLVAHGAGRLSVDHLRQRA